MKRICFLILLVLSIGTCFPAASQVEFVASLKTVTVENSEAATLTMQLTPTFTLDVAVTSLTEIRGQGDAELTVADLDPGMILKIEGVFTEGGILAKEIQVFDGVADFEIKAPIDSVDAAAKQIVVLGLTIKVTDETKIRDCDGNELEVADLQAGQLAKIEGSSDNGLVATSIIACSLEFKPPRIAFEGVITEVNDTGIVVQVEGVDNVPVKITDETIVKGNLVVGAHVRVVGVIGEDLAVAATKIVVMQSLMLAPSKIENMQVGQSHPVAIILHAFYQADVKLAVVSLDPAIAEVSAAEVTVPAGKLTASFRVIAKAVGETTVEVTLPTEMGGEKAVLPVEVKKANPSGQMEIRWVPSSFFLHKGQSRPSTLLLKAPAASALDVTLSQVSGDAGVVQFPATVSIKAGAKFGIALFTAGQKSGKVQIRATLPDSAGGKTADVQIEVKQK